MILNVQPTARLSGRIHLPASKSYSIRAFIVAACGGTSTIIAPSDCDDARVALSVARALGAKVSQPRRDKWQLKAQAVCHAHRLINVGESGTVLRFLLPLLPFFQTSAVVTGRGTLLGRPNHHLTSLLRSQGVDIRGEGERESVPIHFRGGQLKGGRLSINGSLSSQFISALLIACPRLKHDVQLEIKGRQIVSTEYIMMTRQILARSGISIVRVDDRHYRIPGAQEFKGLKDFIVPSDYGLGAFLLAAGILTESHLTLQGYFNDELVQADGKILDFLAQMGVRVSKSAESLGLIGPQTFNGGKFSLKDCPDLVPVMAVLALFAREKTMLRDIRHARVKESDRISDLRSELLKVGADVKEKENGLVITPRPLYRGDVMLDPHRDHRLAMAFCILGLKVGVKIKDIECVSKSYPGFIRDMQQLGARVKSGKT